MQEKEKNLLSATNISPKKENGWDWRQIRPLKIHEANVLSECKKFESHVYLWAGNVSCVPLSWKPPVARPAPAPSFAVESFSDVTCRESLSPLATSRVYAKKKERASLLFPPTSVAEIAWAYCVGVMGFNAGALMVWSYVAREVERSPLCLEWCNAPQRPVFAGGAARCAQTCLFAGVCRNFFSFIRFLWTTFKIYFRMYTCMHLSSIVSILLIT